MFSSYDPSLELCTILSKQLVSPTQVPDRQIPILTYIPEIEGKKPLIIFSHGIGASRRDSAFFGKAWAKRGYVAMFIQHPGSDVGIMKGLSHDQVVERQAAFDKGIDLSNFFLRVWDIPDIIDTVELWAKDEKHILYNQIDFDSIGMSGHSFGAWTAQIVAGEYINREHFKNLNFPEWRETDSTDSRIKAAVIMSPSSPEVETPEEAFSNVQTPWLLITGTHDASDISSAAIEKRYNVFKTLAEGNKYELVLDKAQHSIFTERPLPNEKLPRNPNHQPAIMTISSAFWDAYLKQDTDALNWLQNGSVRTVLEDADSWKMK